MTVRMSLETLLSDGKTTASVAVAILVYDIESLPGSFDALGRQVYEAAATYVVGGGDEARRIAADRDAAWLPSVRELLAAVPESVTFVWLLHDRARPRPDALRSLVVESIRVDASVAGSKVLALEEPARLVSVGMATDVFEVPYSGLDPDEVDQQQYEVVRDVATLPPGSLLVRRDLLRGLHGVDRLLEPQSATTDLCQRARLRGARVVVAPSSEVLYPSPPGPRSPSWREEAGRIRAAIKVYSPLTLLWMLPLALLIGLAEAVVAPLVGRWTLFNLIRAWAWNLVHLPSAVAARWQARKGRVVGDEELFRYQVGGSARLRALTGEVGDRIRERLPEAEGRGLTGILEVGQQTLRSPNFLVGLGVIVVALAATRSVWGGTLPAIGFTLPPADSATGTLRAYAGGWNVAGFGSPAPLHPSVGLAAVIQYVLGGRADLAAAVLTVAAVLGGAIGMGRLLRSWRIGAVAAYAGGIVYVAGPGVQALAGRGEWTALLAAGAVPWVLRVCLRRWPPTMRGRIGVIAAAGWLTGVAAAGLPLLLVVAPAVLALWALLGQEARWWAPLRAAAGSALGMMMLFPWFGVTDLYDYLEAGTAAFWRPWWPGVVLVGVTGVAAVLGAGDRLHAAIAGWGLALGAGGLALGRAAELDAGRDVAATGMVLAALGVAAVAAAALEGLSHIERLPAPRQLLTAVGVAGGVLLAGSTLLLIGPGRAGLPEDVYRDALRFTAIEDDPTAARVLLAGPADALPGDSRLLDGAAYRVVSAPVPNLGEARLAEPRIGDEALETTLRSIIAGEVARAGEVLAEFGIRWVVVVGPSPFEGVFDAQLDLVPLSGLDRPVFLSEVEAVRAQAGDGTVWSWDSPDYRGPVRSQGSVRVAENADRRWGPGPWRQAGWANEVSAAEGVASFEPHEPYRREAMAAGGLGAFLFVTALWGTGRKAAVPRGRRRARR